MIKIDFALGDFDGTPIALAEEDKEEGGAKGLQQQARGNDSDSDDEDGVSGSKAVDSIFRVDK